MEGRRVGGQRSSHALTPIQALGSLVASFVFASPIGTCMCVYVCIKVRSESICGWVCMRIYCSVFIDFRFPVFGVGSKFIH